MTDRPTGPATLIEDLARAYDIVKPDPGMDGPHGGYIGGISRERAAMAIQNALEVLAAPAADGLDVERLAAAMERMVQTDRLILQSITMLPAKDGSGVYVAPGTYDDLAAKIAAAYLREPSREPGERT